ncbi:hypothetical protein C0989_001996 [Termitomyces sp. Mn162]|nr:hypothetical protein C0989_001996 [Termitomyces sp. Mn162]
MCRSGKTRLGPSNKLLAAYKYNQSLTTTMGSSSTTTMGSSSTATMGSSSTFPAFPPMLELDDLDAVTSRLIAELMLQDIAEISMKRKGKARFDAPLSDEELAFRMQRELWENTVRAVNDYAMAKSLNDAIDTDHRYLRTLSITEQAAEDDRQAALALSNGGQLPPQSDAQRLMEDPSFSDISEPYVLFSTLYPV